MKTKILLTSLVIGVAVFFLGVAEYYLNEDDVYFGNYLMASGFIMLGILSLVYCFNETRKIIKTPNVLGIIALFLSPIVIAYVISMVLLMGTNLISMYVQGYSMIEEFIYSGNVFTSVGYWITFIFIEAIFGIIVLNKPEVKRKE